MSAAAQQSNKQTMRIIRTRTKHVLPDQQGMPNAARQQLQAIEVADRMGPNGGFVSFWVCDIRVQLTRSSSLKN